MLTLEAPFFEIKDVLVFRDHSSLTTFYYLAGPPHLTVDDGNVQFTLLKYRTALDADGSVSSRARDQLGGAFLMIGVDCKLGEDVKNAIESELATRVPNGAQISLVPVLYTHGIAKVVVLDYQPPATGASVGAAPPPGSATTAGTSGTPSKFVRSVVGSTTPSLLQDQRAIFSISLDPDAATLIEDAYEADMSPIGVMYELEFSGLLPALSVRATVDMKRCYESFKAGLQVGVTSGGGTTDPQQMQPPQEKKPLSPPSPDPSKAAPQGGPVATPPQTPQQKQPVPPPSPDPSKAAPQGSPIATPSQTPQQEAPVPLPSPDPSKAAPQGGPLATPAQTPQQKQPVPPPQAMVAPQPRATAPSPLPVNPPPPAQPTQTRNQSTEPSPDKSGSSSKPTTMTGTQVAIDADLSYMMEKLRQEEAIKIEIVQEQQGKSVDDMLKQTMDFLKDDLIKAFFKPMMTSTSAPATASNPPIATTDRMNKGVAGAGTKVNIGFELQYKSDDELNTLIYDYTAQMPETRTHAPNGFFSALLRGTDKDKHIREINLDDAFFKILDVQTTTIADFAAIDLKTITVDLAYGGTVDQPEVMKTHTFTPSDAAPKSFQAFLDNEDMSFRNRISYYFAQSEIGAQRTEYQTDWRTTISRAVVVSPPDDIAMLHVYVEQGVIDWDLIAKIETQVTYEDPPNDFRAEQTFLIGPDFKRQEWIVRLTNPAVNTYKVQHTWFLKDDNRQIHGQPQIMHASQLFVPDPFVQRMSITIEPEVDPTSVQRIALDLHYQDPDNQLDVHKFVDLPGPTYKPTTVALPMMDAAKRSFSYQCTLIKSADSENRPEIQTDQPRIIITESGIAFDVTVQLLGDLAQSNMSGLQLDLRSEPLDRQQQKLFSHLFEPGGDKRFAQRLLLRADRPSHSYEYKTTIYRPTGDPVESDWSSNDSAILVLQPAQLLASH